MRISDLLSDLERKTVSLDCLVVRECSGVCVGQWGRSDWLELITAAQSVSVASLSGLARLVTRAGSHCPDISRGHYHHSDTIIPLSCTQYRQYRGEDLKHLHFTLSVCQSEGEIIPGRSITQLFLSPLRSNSINCEKSEHLNTSHME